MTVNLDDLKQRAKQQWDALQNSTRPRIFVGMATCGRSAGATEVLDALGDQRGREQREPIQTAVGRILEETFFQGRKRSEERDRAPGLDGGRKQLCGFLPRLAHRQRQGRLGDRQPDTHRQPRPGAIGSHGCPSIAVVSVVPPAVEFSGGGMMNNRIKYTMQKDT